MSDSSPAEKTDLIQTLFRHSPKLEDVSVMLHHVRPDMVINIVDDLTATCTGLIGEGRKHMDQLGQDLDRNIDQATEMGFDGVDFTLDNAGSTVDWLRQNMEAIVATGFRIGDAAEQITAFAGDFARHRADDTAEGLKAFTRSDSLADYRQRQQRSIEDGLTSLRGDIARFSDLLPALGREILHPVSDRISATVEQVGVFDSPREIQKAM